MSKWKDLGLRAFFIAVFVFAVYSNVRAIIQNNNLTEKVHTTQKAVDDLQTKAKKFELLSLYYQSSSYQEIEARRRLGLKKADETAIIIKGITKESALNFESIDSPSDQAVDASSQSNPSRWLDYFFAKK